MARGLVRLFSGVLLEIWEAIDLYLISCCWMRCFIVSYDP